MNRILIAFCAVMVATAIGCSFSNYDRAKKFLDGGNLEAAIEYLEATIAEGVATAPAHRELGIAYYRKNDYLKSINHLKIALKLAPEDHHTALFLGIAFEKLEEYENSIIAYRAFADLVASDEIRSEVEARVLLLKDRERTKLALEAIAGEAKIELASIPDKSIAVHHFRIFSNRKDLRTLEKAITELVISDLSKVRQLHVVERQRLQKLIYELNIDQDAIFNANITARIGKMLGVANIIGGAVEGSEADRTIRIYPKNTDVRGKSVAELGLQEGNESLLFDLEKSIVIDILSSIGITPSARERKEILEMQTRNIFALSAFGRGLDAFDNGELEAAIEQFRWSLSSDPNFELAQKYLSEAKLLAYAETQEMLKLEKELTVAEQKRSRLRNRLNFSEAQLSREFMPSSANDRPRERNGDGNIASPTTRATIMLRK